MGAVLIIAHKISPADVIHLGDSLNEPFCEANILHNLFHSLAQHLLHIANGSFVLSVNHAHPRAEIQPQKAVSQAIDRSGISISRIQVIDAVLIRHPQFVNLRVFLQRVDADELIAFGVDAMHVVFLLVDLMAGSPKFLGEISRQLRAWGAEFENPKRRPIGKLILIEQILRVRSGNLVRQQNDFDELILHQAAKHGPWLSPVDPQRLLHVLTQLIVGLHRFVNQFAQLNHGD